MPKHLSWLVALALAAGACAGAPDQRTATCAATQSVCEITVKVTGACNVDVPIDKLVVAERKGVPVEIVWKIEGDAVFARANGIDFKPAGFVPSKPGYPRVDDPTNVFVPSPTPPASDKEVRKRNVPKRGEYYYGVNVVQGGQACKEYDPGVINQ